MKRAIRYLRFSQKGQSMGSIERQELYTDQWIQHNKIILIDTFKDEGKSARSFDRPDFKKLQHFVAKHHKNVDYLLVDQLDRFSRNAAEAIAYVKDLQKQFNIQVVSVTEGIMFDYDTPGSFFRAGLQLLLAEEDNINRSIKVRGGIYTAKAKEGRFIYKTAPFGYIKTGLGKERTIIIQEEQASIVRYIYDAYLQNVPLYKIKEKARELGFDVKGNMAVERVLENPTYAGLIKAAAFKDLPGGFFTGNHEAIIDVTLWRIVQEKRKPDKRKRISIDDNLPLRGVLHCFCGLPITGAPSTGRSGNKFFYYRCTHSSHAHLSAKNTHGQIGKILANLNVPEEIKSQVVQRAKTAYKKELVEISKRAEKFRRLLEETNNSLTSLEYKYINNEVNAETYHKWQHIFQKRMAEHSSRIAILSSNLAQADTILLSKLACISDLAKLFQLADTIQKRKLIEMVFLTTLFCEKDEVKYLLINKNLSIPSK